MRSSRRSGTGCAPRRHPDRHRREAPVRAHPLEQPGAEHVAAQRGEDQPPLALPVVPEQEAQDRLGGERARQERRRGVEIGAAEPLGLRHAQARVKRRPTVGEADSSRRRSASSIVVGLARRCFSASSLARRSGVSSPAFSSSIRCSHSAPAACSAASTSIFLVVVYLSISLNSSSTSCSVRHLLQRLAAREDQALVLGAGDAEVGVRGLADAVDRAAEHRDLDRVRVGLEAALDVGHDGVHVELQAAAGRAGDQHRAALAQLQRLEDLPGDLDLLLGVEGRERDPDRVADAVGQQRAEADRGLQRARPLRARLGDAEVQRVRDALAQQAVGGDRVRHVGRLDRDLEVAEVEALHQRHELGPGRDQRLDGVLALERVQVLGQRAGVDADAHRRAGGLRAVGDLGDLLGAADVARVQADAVRARRRSP